MSTNKSQEFEPLSNEQIKVNSQYILYDDSGNAQYCDKECYISLTESEIVVHNTNGKSLTSAQFVDIIGAKQSLNSKKNLIKLEIYQYVLKSSIFCSSGSRQLSILTISFKCDASNTDSNENIVKNWVNVINAYAAQSIPQKIPDSNDYAAPKQRKFVVFVNPHSGPGKSLSIWKSYVSHMLSEANVEVELLITTHSNHACDYVQHVEGLLGYAGVATIGGDGILCEVVTGISERSDGEQVFKTVPLLPIPGGSSNGLVKSMLFESGMEYSITNAIFLCLKGSPAPLDMSLVTTASQKKYYSFLMLAWGLISDVDILSETMRWMGEPRLYVAAVYYICRKKTYHGKLSMLLATEDNKSFSPADMPALTEPLPTPDIENPASASVDNSWKVIEGSFTMIWVIQTSHTASSMYSGPGVTLNDGTFTIYVIQDMGRCDMLSLLLTIDSGDFVKNPKIYIYKARAYRLEPLVSEKGLFSMDGEVIEYGPIQSVVLPGHAKINKK